MPYMYDPKSGKQTWIPDEDVESAWKDGRFVFAKGTQVNISHNGQYGAVDESELGSVFANGATYDHASQRVLRHEKKYYEDQPFETFGLGIGRGIGGTIADAALVGIGAYDREELDKYHHYNPKASVFGQVVGAIGAGVASGGTGILAKGAMLTPAGFSARTGAVLAGKFTSQLGTKIAAKSAGTAAGMAGQGLKQNLLGRAAGGILEAGTDATLFSVTGNFGEVLLGSPHKWAENVASELGANYMLIGGLGAVGGALGGLSGLAGFKDKALGQLSELKYNRVLPKGNKLSSLLDDYFQGNDTLREPIQRAIEGVGSEADNKILNDMLGQKQDFAELLNETADSTVKYVDDLIDIMQGKEFPTTTSKVRAWGPLIDDGLAVSQPDQMFSSAIDMVRGIRSELDDASVMLGREAGEGLTESDPRELTKMVGKLFQAEERIAALLADSLGLPPGGTLKYSKEAGGYHVVREGSDVEYVRANSSKIIKKSNISSKIDSEFNAAQEEASSLFKSTQKSFKSLNNEYGELRESLLEQFETRAEKSGVASQKAEEVNQSKILSKETSLFNAEVKVGNKIIKSEEGVKKAESMWSASIDEAKEKVGIAESAWKRNIDKKQSQVELHEERWKKSIGEKQGSLDELIATAKKKAEILKEKKSFKEVDLLRGKTRAAVAKLEKELKKLKDSPPSTLLNAKRSVAELKSSPPASVLNSKRALKKKQDTSPKSVSDSRYALEKAHEAGISVEAESVTKARRALEKAKEKAAKDAAKHQKEMEEIADLYRGVNEGSSPGLVALQKKIDDASRKADELEEFSLLEGRSDLNYLDEMPETASEGIKSIRSKFNKVKRDDAKLGFTPLERQFASRVSEVGEAQAFKEFSVPELSVPFSDFKGNTPMSILAGKNPRGGARRAGHAADFPGATPQNTSSLSAAMPKLFGLLDNLRGSLYEPAFKRRGVVEDILESKGDIVRDNLITESNWGTAAKAQSEVNAPFHQILGIHKQVKKDSGFARVSKEADSMPKYRQGFVPSRAKILKFLKDIEKHGPGSVNEEAESIELMKSFIYRAEEFSGAMNKWFGGGDGKPVFVSDNFVEAGKRLSRDKETMQSSWESYHQVSTGRRILGEWNNNVETGGVMEFLKEQGVKRGIQLAGLAVGGWPGMIFGGAAGEFMKGMSKKYRNPSAKLTRLRDLKAIQVKYQVKFNKRVNKATERMLKNKEGDFFSAKKPVKVDWRKRLVTVLSSNKANWESKDEREQIEEAISNLRRWRSDPGAMQESILQGTKSLEDSPGLQGAMAEQATRTFTYAMNNIPDEIIETHDAFGGKPVFGGPDFAYDKFNDMMSVIDNPLDYISDNFMNGTLTADMVWAWKGCYPEEANNFCSSMITKVGAHGKEVSFPMQMMASTAFGIPLNSNASGPMVQVLQNTFIARDEQAKQSSGTNRPAALKSMAMQQETQLERLMTPNSRGTASA